MSGDPSIREALSQAFDSLSAEPEPAPETSPAPQASNAPEPAAAEPAEASAEPEAKATKGRDGKGRFAPKGTKDSAPPEPAEVKPAVVPAAKVPGPVPTTAPPSEPAPPAAPELKAPQSWKATAREKWTALPDEAKAEVLRREKEYLTELQGASESKKFHQLFAQVVAPFEGMIRAEGSEPLKAVANLLQTAAALRTAPPVHKAQLLAEMVRTFGVPIEALDQALAGQTPQQSAQGPAQYRDPRVDQLMTSIQQAQARAQQMQQQRAAQAVEQFAGNAEFLEDVRSSMAALIDAATGAGQELSLQDAYDQACWANPTVRQVLQQRAQAKQAQNVMSQTQKAKVAASSVKNQPAGPSIGPALTDRRAVLEAAWDELSGRT